MRDDYEALNDKLDNIGELIQARMADNARLEAENARLKGEMKHLIAAYVRTLEAGRDYIVALGGSCDPVDYMEANDPALRAARTAIGQTHTQAAFGRKGAPS